MRLPTRYVTVDGYPLDVTGIETSSQANLGYDQFRGTTSHRQLSKLPWTSALGSIVTVYDEGGGVTWQGRLSAPLKIEADDSVRLAAQGHAYQGAKSGRRLPVKVTSVKGWTVGNTAPLNFPQTASAQPTMDYGRSSGHLVENETILTFTSGLDVSMAYFASGAQLRRLSWSSFAASGSPTVKFYGATGPDIANEDNRTLIAEYASVTGITRTSIELPPNGYDALVIRLEYASPQSGDLEIVDPIIWGYPTPTFTLRSHDIARAVADMMGWDASGVGDVGDIFWPSFDWAADVASGLSEATVPEDLRWLLLDDRGHGPVLDFGPWERVWEVSGSTGAVWTLDPLERYTKVVVQYLDDFGKAHAVTAEVDDPDLFRVTNELSTVAGGLQSVDTPGTLPEEMAANILGFATSERWRGTISAGRAVESGVGLSDIYRVRGGDLVRIIDFSPTDGAVTLRIASASQTDNGISMGIEAPSFTAGTLDVTTTGATRGTFVQIDPDAYAPSGGVGSTVPVSSGGPIDTIPDIPGPWKGIKPPRGF